MSVCTGDQAPSQAQKQIDIQTGVSSSNGNASRSGYKSAFSSRYASDEMQHLFSDDFKFRTWRRLWVSLAKAERKLGLNISEEQIAELEAHIDDVNYDVTDKREAEVRHDVMAHVHGFSVQCPKAAPIIHLGTTSCFVGDNTDIVIMRQACRVLKPKIVMVIKNLAKFADQYKDLPCLSYTHLQPAQLTTVGKRATLWLYELSLDLAEIERRENEFLLRGCKGTTGTQATFLELFEGDHEKCKQLEQLIAADFQFEKCAPVLGQTYSRKIDANMLCALSGLGQTASKFAHDLRLLQSFEEIEEPFGAKQIGSSAMPYKRNPMRSERINALARYLITDSLNPAFTAATQWFERTLDDSANKRLAVSEAFLCADAILNILIDVTGGLVVYPRVIARRVQDKLPFMATENIMMRAVKLGADRQEIHERLRVHSHAAAAKVKLEGLENDLIERIAADPEIPLDKEALTEVLDAKAYVGRAPQQVAEFLDEEIQPILAKYPDINLHVELKV